MVTEMQLFESTFQTALDFCSWDWMKREVCKRKVDTPDGLPTRILDAMPA
jgi:hypothetical protein